MWASAANEAGQGQGFGTGDNGSTPAPSAPTTENPAGEVGTGFVSDFLSTWVNDKLIGIGKGLFYIGGIIFDTFIGASLSSDFIRNDSFVSFGWVIVRDIANTAFIFVLLYIAIMTILQAGGTGMKELVVSLIIAALFVNFSLYITRFVIDISNVVATEFYNKIGFAPEDVPSQMLIQGKPVRSISAAFSGRAAAMDLGMKDEISKDTDSSRRALRTIALGLSACILYFVGFFILLSAGFLFFARAIALWFVMIFAPLAFVAVIIPGGAKKIWGKWSSTLVSQALMAPIFLFFLYLIFAFMNPEVFGAQKNLITYSGRLDQTAGNGGIASVLINDELPYIILMGMLVAALGIAREMAGKIGSTTEKYGKLGVGGVVAGAAAGAAYAGRRYIGGNINSYLKQTDAEGRTREERLRSSRFGRATLGVLDSGRKGSWDVRGAGAAGYTVGSVMKQGGLGFSTPSGQGGYAARWDESLKKNKAEYDSIKDPKLKAKYLHSKSPQMAATLYAQDSANSRQEIASKSPEYRAMFQGLNATLSGKEQDSIHKEALGNAKDVRDKDGNITKTKEMVRLEYLHGLANTGMVGKMDPAKAAEQRRKNLETQRKALETLSPDEAAKLLKTAQSNTAIAGPDQVAMIQDALQKTGPEEKSKIYQAIIGKAQAVRDEQTGAITKTAARVRAEHISQVTDPKARQDLIESIAAPTLAEIREDAGVAQSQIIDQAIEKMIPEQQVKAHQAILRRMKDKVDPSTGKTTLAAETQKVQHFASIKDAAVRNELFSDQPADTQADMLYHAKGTPSEKLVNDARDVMPAGVKERIRNAEIDVKRREETRRYKDVIRQAVSGVPKGTPLPPEASKEVRSAMESLQPRQVADLEAPILMSGHLDDYMTTEKLKAINERGGLERAQTTELLDRYVRGIAGRAETGDKVAKQTLASLRKYNTPLFEMLGEGSQNMVIALTDKDAKEQENQKGNMNTPNTNKKESPIISTDTNISAALKDQKNT